MKEVLLQETPKPNDLVFEKVHNLVIGNNQTASLAAIDFLASKGLNTLLLADLLNGEAKEVGKVLAKLASEGFVCMDTSRSLGVVAGGETTVTVQGKRCGRQKSRTCIVRRFEP